MPRLDRRPVSRRGTATLDDHALLDQCREGDLDACRELTARLAPSALRVTYLLTGSRAWSLALVESATVELLLDLRRGREVADAQHALLVEIARRWRLPRPEGDPSSSETAPVPGRRPDGDGKSAQIQAALARFDDHQRGALALHVLGGLPVEALAGVLGITPDVVYVQIKTSKERLMSEAGIERAEDLVGALSAVSLEAPRQAIWPDIEQEVRERFAAETRRRRRLNAAAVGIAVLLVIAGAALLSTWGEDDAAPPSATPGAPAGSGPALLQSLPYTVLPTSTATPLADVSDSLLLSSRDSAAPRMSLFAERGPGAAVLGENAIEAAPPIISPDGEQVFLLWYSFDDDGATGYLAAFDGGLTNELWRAVVTVDEMAEPGRQPDFRLRAAVDHERVYVARHLWRGGDPIEIDAFDRAGGDLQETIVTTLPGFVAHDIRLYSPPGSDLVSLLAITFEAPPEIGLLQLTLLTYRVPSGARIHARLLFDHQDSRVLFLYESRLIVGGSRLFGVDYTRAYQQLAVHFFDLDTARLDPKVALPFQPAADPMPYQKVVSHDGRWLYVLSPASLEVAVVDLFDRKLAGIVPLDAGVVAGDDDGVTYLPVKEMQLSPDGARLYAAGSRNSAPSGIWVIDVASWTVVDHWLPDSRPVEILVSGDGGTLYIREESSATPASSRSSLTAINTLTGEPHVVDVPDAERFSLSSIVALYQRSYAGTPSIAGRMPSNTTSTAPLATMAIDVTPQKVAETEAVTVNVRFVHPLTREPVAEGRDGARFESPAGVRATWTPSGGGTPVILELARVEYGHYAGFVNLPETGRWSLRVDVDWPDGSLSDRSMLFRATVNVLPQPSAAGSGRQDAAMDSLNLG